MPVQSPGGPGVAPLTDHPAKSAREEALNGIEAGAPIRTEAPTARCTVQGTAQPTPSTVTVTPESELPTATWASGPKVAVIPTLPSAVTGTTKLCTAGPPTDQLAKAQMRPWESVCWADASIWWVSPTPHMNT